MSFRRTLAILCTVSVCSGQQAGFLFTAERGTHMKNMVVAIVAIVAIAGIAITTAFLTGFRTRPAPALLRNHFIILGRMTAVCSGIFSVISSSLPYFFTFFRRSTKASTVPITL